MIRPGVGTALVVIGLVYILACAVVIMSIGEIWPAVAPVPSSVAIATSGSSGSAAASITPSVTASTVPSAAPPVPTDAGPRASQRPEPTIPPKVTNPPILVASIHGTASFYCLPLVSPCTIGHPDGLYAAAGPELRAALGDWRGRKVTVWRGDAHVSVTLIDFCACPDAMIDLYSTAFVQLAPLSLGVLDVVVRW